MFTCQLKDCIDYYWDINSLNRILYHDFNTLFHKRDKSTKINDLKTEQFTVEYRKYICVSRVICSKLMIPIITS